VQDDEMGHTAAYVVLSLRDVGLQGVMAHIMWVLLKIYQSSRS